jgi:hypothetical protein
MFQLEINFRGEIFPCLRFEAASPGLHIQETVGLNDILTTIGSSL